MILGKIEAQFFKVSLHERQAPAKIYMHPMSDPFLLRDKRPAELPQDFKIFYSFNQKHPFEGDSDTIDQSNQQMMVISSFPVNRPFMYIGVYS